MPAPAIETSRERERRLVLDVLDAHALRAPEERGEGVRSIDDRLDLDAEILRVGDHLVGGVDEHRQVVEQRPLGLAGLARVELDVGAADLDARGPGRLEAVPQVLRGRPLRVARVQGDVVEVVLDVGRRLDERDPDAAACSKTSGVPSGSCARAAARSETRSATCAKAPCSRGPSASNSVSLPRRASLPISVKLSSCAITCMPRCRSRNAATGSRSATQNAT